MIIKELKVLNELGIHARVASKLVRCAKSFECSVNARKGDKLFDFKNVFGVMTINAKYGDLVLIEFEGNDEEAAVIEIEKLFEDKFGEK
jgi:phosphotransferase system HPr (HPr) family protein